MKPTAEQVKLIHDLLDCDTDEAATLLAAHDAKVAERVRRETLEEAARAFKQMQVARERLDSRDYPNQDFNTVAFSIIDETIRALASEPAREAK